MSMKEADAFLMGGGPTVSFADKPIGTMVTGTILAYEKTQQRDFDTGTPLIWDDGSPRWQIVFTLETDERDPEIANDDGTRRLFAKGQMLNAVRDAIKEAGQRGDLVGGQLAVKFIREDEPKRKGAKPPKVYAAKFKARVQTDDLGENEPEDGPTPAPPSGEDEFSSDPF